MARRRQRPVARERDRRGPPAQLPGGQRLGAAAGARGSGGGSAVAPVGRTSWSAFFAQAAYPKGSFVQLGRLAHGFARRQGEFHSGERGKTTANGLRQVPAGGALSARATFRISRASSSIER